jgi:predicted Zn finger-like uncharacterized protein
MIITCPHCQTKYQIAYRAIGSAGRKVQCCYCQQAWRERPAKPRLALVDAGSACDAACEDTLDAAFVAEAEAVSAALFARLAIWPATKTPKNLDAPVAAVRPAHNRPERY